MSRLVTGVGALALAGLALALAACSGTSSSTPSSPSAGSDSAAVTDAQSVVNSLLQRPTAFSVPALPSKPPAGKTIDYMACGAPVCQAYGNVVKEAAATVGWNVEIIQIGLTPDTVTNGYNQAVRNDPAGVIGSGAFPASLMSYQLKELAAEHVPVVLTDVPSAGNATGVLLTSADQAQYGKEMGDWILADSHGSNAHVAIITTPATPIYAATHQALQAALAPCSSCSISTYTYPFTALGTTLPGDVATYLLAHPSINYLFFDFAPAVDGVPAALQANGLSGRVKIVTTDTGPTESAYLKNGQESATAAVPWDEAWWESVNVVLRADMGLPVAPALDVQFPNMIFTAQNLPAAAGSAAPAVIANYPAIFEKAWHVG